MEQLYYEQIDEKVYKKILSNGLTVYLLPKDNVAKSFAVFMTDYGSIHNEFVPLYENESIRVPDGIAHFLEHKLFEKEDRDVFNDFSKLGASPNAYTSFTKTAYLFSATKNLEQCIVTLLDFVQEPYFSEASVEKEKGIITQEIKMYNDQPDWMAYMETIKNMYHHLPVNIDIAGTVDSIQEITKEDLYTCYETFYHPKNMILFVTGNFSAESLGKLIEENQQTKSFEAIDMIEKTYPNEPTDVLKKEKTIQMPVSIPKVSVGIKSSVDGLSNLELIRIELFQQMILDYFFSPSGIYYEQLNEEQLIDDSFEYSTTVEKTFNFSILSSNSEQPEVLSERLKGLLLNMKTNNIDEAAFTTIKKKRIGEILRLMNSLEHIANQYVHYAFLQTDYFDMISFIQGFTLDEFNSFLHDWIEEDQLTSLVIKKE